MRRRTLGLSLLWSCGLVLSWWPGAMPAQEPSRWDLKGIRLGMSIDEFKKLTHPGHARPGCNPEKWGDSADDQLCYVQNETIAGVRTWLFVTFMDGRARNISATGWTSENFDVISSALISKFGEPQQRQTKEVQNPMGATFEDRVLKWTNASGAEQLLLHERAGRMDQGSLMLFDPSFDEDLERAQKAAAAKAAKDL